MTRTTFLTTIPAAIAGWLGLKRWVPNDLPSALKDAESAADKVSDSLTKRNWVDEASIYFPGTPNGWYSLGTLELFRTRQRSRVELSAVEKATGQRYWAYHVTLSLGGAEFNAFRWLDTYRWGPLDRFHRFRFAIGQIGGTISQRSFTRDQEGKIVGASFEITERRRYGKYAIEEKPMPEPIMGADGNLITHHPESCHCGFCRDASGKQWPVMSTTMSIKPGYSFDKGAI